ncbi:MAG: DEAD/DEAH box helicase [Azonexus sp.]|nr:DEAD/DEAH box helicase [Azonexus sp.]MCK6413766.1 DEAD/DEAH box helicase [Azonexus sp.]
MTFAELGLTAPLLQTLAERGYTTPTPIQEQAIPVILQGRDLIAAAETGTGKTAAFALPLLQILAQGEPAPVAATQLRALVLVPTRELAEQVLASLQTYGTGLNLSSYAAYGGVSLNPQQSRLAQGVDVLVATPGRLVDLFTKGAVRFRELRLLVLDEADRMLDLGFAEDLSILFSAFPRQRQTLLFSATFPDAVRGLTRSRLRDPRSVEAGPRNAAARSIEQVLIPVNKARKRELLLELYQRRGWQQLLVFAKTKKGCDELAAALAAAGIAADCIHGDRPQTARSKALAAFKAGEVKVLVATDIAARGLDIGGLPQVVNFDLPLQAEDYIHRVGRTGRAGQPGQAISLVCAEESGELRAIEALLRTSLTRIEEAGFQPIPPLPSHISGAPANNGSGYPARSGRTGNGQRKPPGHWEGLDDFPDDTLRHPGRRRQRKK